MEGENCFPKSESGVTAMQYANGAMNIFSIGMIFTGVPFPITWKLIDIS